MVCSPGAEPRASRSILMRRTANSAQNLACGVLEGRPQPADEEPEEPLNELKLPTQQTKAVAEASRAGRMLVQEVESSSDDSPNTRSRKRRAGAE